MPSPHVQLLCDWNGDGDFLDANEDLSADVQIVNVVHNRDMLSEYMNGRELTAILDNNDHKYTPSKGTISGLRAGRLVWLGAQYPYDTFEGTANTDLSSHTPDQDSNWTWVRDIPLVGGFELDGSGNARVDVIGAGDLIEHLDFGEADVTLRCLYNRQTDTTDHGGVLVRYVNSTNYAYIRVTGTAIETRKVIAGSDSQVNSSAYTWATSTAKHMVVALHGTNCRVFVDQIEVADFTLDDAAINSGTKHGLFADADCDHLWGSFAGFKPLFFGRLTKIKSRIVPDGTHTVTLRAVDAFEEFKRARNRYVNTEASPQDADDMLAIALDAVDWSSTYRQLDGTHVYSQLLTNLTEGTKAMDEPMLDTVYRLQDEEDGYIYVDGMGYVTLEGRDHRANAPHTTSKATYRTTYNGTDPGYTDATMEEGEDNVENRLTALVRINDAAQTDVLVYVSKAAADGDLRIQFDASETRDFLIEVTAFAYVDTWTTPASTTYYMANTAKDGTGTDLTSSFSVTFVETDHFSGRFRKVRVTNGHGSLAGFLTKFQLRGRAYDFLDGLEVHVQDTTSQTNYGERRKEIECEFIDTAEAAQAMLESREARRDDPKRLVDLTLKAGDKPTLTAMIHRRLSDRVTAVDSDAGLNEDFFIEGESWTLVTGGVDGDAKAEQVVQLRAV